MKIVISYQEKYRERSSPLSKSAGKERTYLTEDMKDNRLEVDADSGSISFSIRTAIWLLNFGK